MKESPQEQAIAMRQAGHSLRKIATAVGASLGAVHKWTVDAAREHPVNIVNTRERVHDEHREHPTDGADLGREHSVNGGCSRSVNAQNRERAVNVHGVHGGVHAVHGASVNTDPVEEVLRRLGDVKKQGNQWEANCPAHEDDRASLSVSRGKDGRALINCFAGCSAQKVVGALGMSFKDLFVDGRVPRPRIVAAYDYRNVDGEILFQVVRYEPKDFRQRKPNGKGGWTWKLGETPRVLYRLPELAGADRDQWVFIAEGEKDVDNLWALGLPATCNPGGACKWSVLADDSHLNGRRVVIIPDRDVPGEKHAADVAHRLSGRVAELRIVRAPEGHKDVSDWIVARDALEPDELREALLAAVEENPVPCEELPAVVHTGERPEVIIDTDEYRVVSETVTALSADPGVFHRGGTLVRVLRDRQQDDHVQRSEGAPTIRLLPQPNLRERLTQYAAFTKYVKQGDAVVKVHAHPTPWLVAAIDARGHWPGIRQLMGVSDTPFLRPDGSICQTAGYDAATAVIYQPTSEFPQISDQPTHDDACQARDALLEIVCDFRFEAPEHQAAWLAALLTPLARFAYDGPTPLFLVDANIRGAGKGLLVQAISRVVLGYEMPVSSYNHNPEELRKAITSIAMAGDRVVLFDNLEGPFGNEVLDRALTTTRWKDRILGKNDQADVPLLTVWYGTGNNVQIAADTARRIIHVRLDVLDEFPEERTGFKHPNLLSWIQRERKRLLAAALTILSAYCRAGRPHHNLPPFGSFESWSGLVREAVVWAGLPDPCLTRKRLAEADLTSESLARLMEAWQRFDPQKYGLVVADVLAELYPPLREMMPRDEVSVEMRAALENFVGCPAGKAPTPRQVGNRLRMYRRRVACGMFFDLGSQDRRAGGMVWRLSPQDTPHTPTFTGGYTAQSSVAQDVASESVSAVSPELLESRFQW